MVERALLSIAVIVVAAGLFPAEGRAGVIVALTTEESTPAPNGLADLGVLVLDPLDATRTFPLPAAAVTTQGEEWPQLNGDGSRLLLERSAAVAGGADSLLYVDRTAGTVTTIAPSAGLVPFGALRPFAISPDAQTFMSIGPTFGQTAESSDPTGTSATLLDSTALPAGPFPPVATPQVDLPDENGTPRFVSITAQDRPDVNDARRYTWAVTADSAGDFAPSPTNLLITGIVGGQSRATPVPKSTNIGPIRKVDNPVLTPSDQSTITFDDGTRLGQVRVDATPTFEPLQLPNVTLTNGDFETFPRWSRSGRYLAWISRPFTASAAAVETRIFVYDRDTQGLVRAAGRSIGSRKFGFGLTIAETPSTVASFTLSTPVLSTTNLNTGPTVNTIQLQTTLRVATSVGILVQRVAGHTKLLGRTVPRLKTVGRVPLGPHRKGRNRIPWNGRVAGRRLPRGTYQITMRSIAADGLPSDLSRPTTLRVR